MTTSGIDTVPSTAAGAADGQRRMLSHDRAPRRILIVRTSAIGDIVFATPLAAALRRSYPQAHICWLVEQGLEELLEADPAIDEVLIWPRGAWRQLWRAHRYGALAQAVRALRAQLRTQRFDLALDLQGLLKSGLLTWLSGAARRVGLNSREGSKVLMSDVVAGMGHVERISSEYLHLASTLDLDPGEFVPALHVASAVEQRAHAMLAAHGLAPGAYAVFAPFTTRPQKHWFDDAWVALAARVRSEWGLPLAVLGGPADGERARLLLQGTADVVNLVGATRLAEAAAMVKNARLVVGVDTGLTHMGIAFDRPTVALFGSTRPYLDTCRARARVIWLGLDCSPCRRKPTCGGAFTCLRQITPDRVLDEARAVLAVRP